MKKRIKIKYDPNEILYKLSIEEKKKYYKLLML